MVVNPTQTVDPAATNALKERTQSSPEILESQKQPGEVIARKAEEARTAIDDGSAISKAVQAVHEDLYFTEGMLKDGGLEFLKTSLEMRVAHMFGNGEEDGGSPELAEYKRQSEATSRGDTSPDAAARDVASEALRQFPSFRQQNPGLDETEARGQFSDVLKKDLDEGFDRARETLKQADLLSREVDNTMKGTYAALQQQLAAALGEGL